MLSSLVVINSNYSYPCVGSPSSPDIDMHALDLIYYTSFTVLDRLSLRLHSLKLLSLAKATVITSLLVVISSKAI